MTSITYLVFSLTYLFIWVVLYNKRKDLRREMLIMSSIVTILGLIMEAFVWTKDWWQPETITGTRIGIEDVIFGFALGGITAVIYEEILKKKFTFRQHKDHHRTKELLFLIGLLVCLGSLANFVYGLHSSVSWLIGTIIPTLALYILRRDFIIPSIITAFLITLLGIFSYWVLHLIDPGFIYRWWFFNNLSGIIILGSPLEDIYWYFTVGLFLGPLYEFWRGGHEQSLHRTAKLHHS